MKKNLIIALEASLVFMVISGLAVLFVSFMPSIFHAA